MKRTGDLVLSDPVQVIDAPVELLDRKLGRLPIAVGVVAGLVCAAPDGHGLLLSSLSSDSPAAARGARSRPWRVCGATSGHRGEQAASRRAAVRWTHGSATSRSMGWISYHRAGVAKRQARTAFEYARMIESAVQELATGCARLAAIVDEHEAALDELRAELADLRRRRDA